MLTPTTLAFILHIASGTIGLVSGTIAVFASKGGPLHRAAGKIFVGAMLIMAVFACYLAVVMPDQIVNLIIGTFAFYLVATAWLTVRRRDSVPGMPEKIAFVDDAFNIIDIVSEYRDSGVTPGGYQLHQFLNRRIDIDSDDVRARCHDLPCHFVAELHDGLDHFPLVAFEYSFNHSFVHYSHAVAYA